MSFSEPLKVPAINADENYDLRLIANDAGMCLKTVGSIFNSMLICITLLELRPFAGLMRM